MKPPFAYFGGKSRMAERIAELLPPHDVYLEPFLGSGAVFFAKEQSRHEILNDLNGDIVTFFRVLRDQPDELERACRLTPYSREEYDRARCSDTSCVDDIERARLWFVMVNQSFAKTARRNTGWSRTIAQNHSAPKTIATRLGRFQAVAERLAEAMIEHVDAFDLISSIGNSDRSTAIYVDPPYLRSTRRTSPNAGGSSAGCDYEIDMGKPEDHERLAAVLNDVSASVILSGYPSALYDELYAGWDRISIDVVSSAGRWTQANERRTEVLWSNRPIDKPNVLDFSQVPA